MASEAEQTSGMSTVESVDFISSEGETDRSRTWTGQAAGSSRGWQQVQASSRARQMAGTPASSGKSTPRAGYKEQDFELLASLMSNLKKLDQELRARGGDEEGRTDDAFVPTGALKLRCRSQWFED